jgi:hypothetical protein
MNFKDNIVDTIILPELFIKRIIKNSTKNSILEELTSFSNMHNYNLDQVIYSFVMFVLNKNLYESIETKVFDEFVYTACYWASNIETKKKIRPSNMENMPKEKNKNYYTKLQQKILLAVFKKFENKNSSISADLNFQLEIGKYLILFFELSCIKRDRRK